MENTYKVGDAVVIKYQGVVYAEGTITNIGKMWITITSKNTAAGIQKIRINHIKTGHLAMEVVS